MPQQPPLPRRSPPRRPGISLMEMLLAFAVLVVCLIPLIEVMITTTKGVKLTRDYLIGYNMAQLAFEQVMHVATLRSDVDFTQLATQYDRRPTGSGPSPNGCPGVSVSALSTSATDIILPDDGVAEFNPQSGEKDFTNLFTRYSYTMSIAPAPPSADTVVSPADSKAALARVDVKVFWKNPQGECQAVAFSDYISRRKF
jgi:hypothetical protein